ncbi:SGNH/GDSL hydrolase family protein [Kribbella albertanoniae]|uniref:SGNH/GDSL hydrolase family protein n=1 Tax=Kribbella albertanoniae TaxID=1266829 RepID=A0A4R4PL08_9ACTN|nr:SGNH/GDSL hydrolase family protein [Kribbella albertanoniae]TDC22706.1 SGNH/GDSL hydrolase family protein [Kribbella albertanoniae]
MKFHRAIAAVTGLLLTTALTVAPATAGGPQYREYVALGDSYTSAPFVPIPDLLSLGCARSYSNYPKLVAGALGIYHFTDVSCGGADTTHMLNPQSTVLGTARPQFDALTPETDLVTLGIGGNDFGVFGSIIGTCPGLRASDPTGAPCKAHFTVDGVDTLKAKIAQTQTRIATVVQGIKQRSPQATILLVGYPKIAPEHGTCPDILPFADGDYSYLYSIEQTLNAAVSNAAAATGATYVDTFGPSTGHDACAPDGVAWIQGKDLNLLRAANYHPRYEGQAGVASLTFKKLTGKPATVTASEQAAWAAKGRELTKQAATFDRGGGAGKESVEP